MKNNPFTGKSTRTKIFTAVSLICIVLLLLLNIFMMSFTVYGNGYIDLTPEGLYTLRGVMVDASKEILCDKEGKPIDPGIKVTFCSDPDKLISNTFTRVVYYMCIAMSKRFDNFTVETVNVQMNPTDVAEYKTTSLTVINPTDVIVSYGSRYNIVPAEEFWRIGESAVVSYDGEYKLASVMMSLTMVNRPIAYFVTDHGETYYDVNNRESEGSVETEAFARLLMEKGFDIKTVSLRELIENAEAENKTPSIPEDCVLLIINNPTFDFRADADRLNSLDYVSETELLDRYMTDARGAIMVAKDYRIQMPNFDDFLAEWGIVCKGELIKDDERFIGESTTLVTEYNKNEGSYANSIYSDYANLASAPITVVSDTGHIECSFVESVSAIESGTKNTSRNYLPFLYTSSSAVSYKGENYGDIASDAKTFTVAAVSGRSTMESFSGNSYYSYLFCAASASFFSSELIGNTSYANRDVMSSLIQNIARLESYADDSLGGLSLNNKTSFLGKMLVEMKLGEDERAVYEWDENVNKNVLKRTVYGISSAEKIVFTVIVALIPLTIAVVGVVVCVKRKYL